MKSAIFLGEGYTNPCYIEVSSQEMLEDSPAIAPSIFCLLGSLQSVIESAGGGGSLGLFNEFT